MIPRLLTLWDRIRTSFWALPLLAILVATALAFVAASIRIAGDGGGVWYLYRGDAVDVADFLASLTTATMTLATLVVSITMVVLTLAAQQLGPRLIKSFMRDWLTQSALALFFGSVAYLLVLLRITSGIENDVPNLAVTIGSVLVWSTVLMVPVFVHHLARSIVSDSVIDRVGAALDRAAEEMLPVEPAEQADRSLLDRARAGAPMRLRDGGYVQAVDTDRLAEAAARDGALVLLTYRPGQHMLPGAIVAWVDPPAAATTELDLAIREGVLVGEERTPVQDLEFSIRQLVEVALRALSPGVQDPFTAIAVTDRLAVSVARIMRRGSPQSVWRDDSGAPRLILPVSDFEGILDAAFNQIRQAGADDAAVIMRLAEKLGQLLQHASEEQKRPLLKHLDMVEKAGLREISGGRDRQAFDERIEAASLDAQTREVERERRRGKRSTASPAE